MTNRTVLGLCVSVFILCIGAGCGISRRDNVVKQTYLLKVEPAQETVSAPVTACFEIRMTRVAPAFSGRQLVYRTGPVRYEQDYYHTYLSAPAEQFDEIITRWFRDSRQFVCRPAADASQDILTLEPHLDELYVDFQTAAQPEGVAVMHFYLSRYDEGCGCPVEVLKKSYTARTPITSEKPRADELVSAMSLSIAKILTEVENDIAERLRTEQ